MIAMECKSFRNVLSEQASSRTPCIIVGTHHLAQGRGKEGRFREQASQHTHKEDVCQRRDKSYEGQQHADPARGEL